jgi:hypothetical protein
MIVLLCFLLRLLPSPFKSTTGRLEAENAALQHQIARRRRSAVALSLRTAIVSSSSCCIDGFRRSVDPQPPQSNLRPTTRSGQAALRTVMRMSASLQSSDLWHAACLVRDVPIPVVSKCSISCTKALLIRSPCRRATKDSRSVVCAGRVRRFNQICFRNS